jgi:hypothetical protein
MGFQRQKHRLRIMGFAFIGSLFSTLGCGGLAVSSGPDKEVIDSIQSLRPEYQLDNYGRVMTLKLERRHLDESVLTQIGRLENLRTLSLYGSVVADGSLVKLKGLKRLEGLGLGGTGISDDGLSHLKELNGLRWLWLPAGCKVSDIKALELQRQLPGLTIYRQE